MVSKKLLFAEVQKQPYIDINNCMHIHHTMLQVNSERERAKKVKQKKLLQVKKD